VSAGDLDENRVFVGKVLIERADGNAGLGGDLVGRGIGVSGLVENASSRLDDAIDGLVGTALSGRFTWV
jgi:hypothetical protein